MSSSTLVIMETGPRPRYTKPPQFARLGGFRSVLATRGIMESAHAAAETPRHRGRRLHHHGGCFGGLVTDHRPPAVLDRRAAVARFGVPLADPRCARWSRDRAALAALPRSLHLGPDA